MHSNHCVCSAITRKHKKQLLTNVKQYNYESSFCALTCCIILAALVMSI